VIVAIAMMATSKTNPIERFMFEFLGQSFIRW
jgi:hypothetical protein